jgi:HK97 gp10 family phage protein
MAKKYRGSSVKRGNLIEMYGVKDLLNKIEKAGGKVDEAVSKAVDESLKIVGADMQNFMLGHKDTGDTLESYTQLPSTIKDGKVESIVGYEIKKGGLPAIFLDVGTPTQKGYFFRYYAVENNRQQIEEIQRQTLNDILKELK